MSARQIAVRNLIEHPEWKKAQKETEKILLIPTKSPTKKKRKSRYKQQRTYPTFNVVNNKKSFIKNFSAAKEKRKQINAKRRL